MNFTSLPNIIEAGLSWFFTTEIMNTVEFVFFKNLFMIILGFLAFYFLAIKPFIIAFRCIIRDWRMKK